MKWPEAVRALVWRVIRRWPRRNPLSKSLRELESECADGAALIVRRHLENRVRDSGQSSLGGGE